MPSRRSPLTAITETVCTIYFDGACPICAREIATYQSWRGGDRIHWVDASHCSEQELGEELERTQALAKLHARDENGVLVSGAAAFVTIWQQLPALKWMTPCLERAWFIRLIDRLYFMFLKIRPWWRKL